MNISKARLMKYFALLLSAIIITNAVYSQNVVHDSYAEVRTVSSFDKIKVSGALTIYLSQGNTQGLAISTQDGKYNDRIKTEVSGGVLNIYVDNGMWNNWNWSNKNVRAYITITDLQLLDVNGACSVKITDPISVNDMKLDLSGASSLSGNIKSNALKIDISGASSMNLDGTSQDLKIDASGASSFRGFDFTSINCAVDASGASDVNISVGKELQAQASGASSIKYSGDAVVTKLDVSSGSSVKKKS